MNPRITTAGRLLVQLKSLQRPLSGSGTLGSVLKSHYSNEAGVSWYSSVLRFDNLISEVVRDIDVLPIERHEKYKKTITDGPSKLVDPVQYAATEKDISRTILTELLFERVENLHDHLISAGRSLSLEEVRARSVVDEIASIINDIGETDSTEIDIVIVEHLKQLLYALERYELFGPDGVRDYVKELVGAVVLRSMEIKAIPQPVKVRIQRTISVAKAVMDGYVYLATGAQMLEWGGAKVSGLLGTMP